MQPARVMALTPEEKEENDQVGMVIGAFFGVSLACVAIYLIGGEWPFGTKSEMILRGLSWGAGFVLRFIVTDDDEGLPKGLAYGWLATYLLFFLLKLVGSILN